MSDKWNFHWAAKLAGKFVCNVDLQDDPEKINEIHAMIKVISKLPNVERNDAVTAMLIEGGNSIMERVKQENYGLIKGTDEYKEYMIAKKNMEINNERKTFARLHNIYNGYRDKAEFDAWAEEIGQDTTKFYAYLSNFPEDESAELTQIERHKLFLETLLRDVPAPGLHVDIIKIAAQRAEVCRDNKGVIEGWDTLRVSAGRLGYTQKDKNYGYWCHPVQRIDENVQ